LPALAGNDWTCSPDFSSITRGTGDLASTTISYRDTNGGGHELAETQYFYFAVDRTIKKTLTIPKWLNDLGEKNRVNFSHILQDALMNHLGVNRKRP
jgi:hypothetical protein